MDSEDNYNTLLQKHRDELRELQARVVQKKKNATKKTRKRVIDECTSLERDLRGRHIAELAAQHGTPRQQNEQIVGDAPNLDEGRDTVSFRSNGSAAELLGDTAGAKLANTIFTEATTATAISEKVQDKKPSRQKARLARRAANQAAAIAEAEAEATNIPDLRAREQALMSQEIERRKLEEIDIRSDGHCLYAAVADQLLSRNLNPLGHNSLDYRVIRQDAANFIEEHSQDFEAFLEESLPSYVAKIRGTGEWGGQLELSAIAKSYGIVINILQGDGRIERIEPGDKPMDTEIWLAYYRHSFGLGEHYNSLRIKS